MNIFAIDLGNKRIKMKSERGEYSYPSAYLNAEQVASGGLGSLKNEDNYYFQLEDDFINSFVWGPHLEVYNLPEKMIDTYGRSGRMKQRKATRILEFALGRLALDYPESYETPLVVHLTLGLSITDFHKDAGIVNILKELAIGEHRIKINNRQVNILIPSESFISIIPQYMGTVLNLAFDNQLQRNLRFSEGVLGVVDIGGGTILVNRSVGLNPSPNGDERFEGIQTLIKTIGHKINSTKSFLIEALLRSSEKEGSYIYCPNANNLDVRDITSVVQEEVERYTRFTVAPLISENFPDIEEVNSIVITGGGANLLDKEALQDEIGEEYYGHLYFMKEPEFANVRGFYKGGFLKWCVSEDEQKQEKEGNTKKPSTVLETSLINPIENDITKNNINSNSERNKKIIEAQKKFEELKTAINKEISQL